MEGKEADASTPPLERLQSAAVEYLHTKGYTSPGLFRRPGNVTELRALIARANDTGNCDLSDVDDPHLVATLLCTLLREASPPLLDFDRVCALDCA